MYFRQRHTAAASRTTHMTPPTDAPTATPTGADVDGAAAAVGVSDGAAVAGNPNLDVAVVDGAAAAVARNPNVVVAVVDGAAVAVARNPNVVVAVVVGAATAVIDEIITALLEDTFVPDAPLYKSTTLKPPPSAVIPVRWRSPSTQTAISCTAYTTKQQAARLKHEIVTP
jgi:hypothetical protein